ncbi:MULTISPECIES: threonine ammonia-lyase IlvA [unclassified Amycolatopsis]|uniref:threonine ammonia-lyase IlvA n=1 Tax=unclassified Amycolatopsis TaxID=2618356 RepID=UPI001FF1003F|nr:MULTISPECIES: threonine ammonia-lyase IlvA [unclassified Amycolatopsis]UOZ10593.1 threonine ammonia-lyase IlvA [Amycolatopsis sp. WQ 127309]WSJ76887.1 threonine ammonia-lyase IlvA [Amycolatopsis sp. NBC_01307]WSK79538.1 threonine ammonia-lyase IlvA [Amycolatopsis sp. NBC_01286]
MHDIDTVTAATIENAAARLAGVVTRTPLEPSARLSSRVDAQVWVKREDLQTVRSYKIRGAYNFIVQLDDVTRALGVVCASAGNHAQGVAYACRRLGANGRVYVPGTTPRQKRERIATLGGAHIEVIVVGETYEDAFAAATEDAERTGATLVPAFDDVRTVAGQGTVALEVIEQLGFVPDVVVVPVGGGGLLAGVGSFLRERHPGVRVVGVEPAGAACMAAALDAGHPVRLPELDTFVDGAAVRVAGSVTYPLIRESGAELTSVAEGAICTEMLAMYQSDGIIAEPAGALAAASLGSVVDVEPGQTVVVVVSGGNNDVSRYSEILERSLMHEQLKHYFLVGFPQEPGALRRFLEQVLGPEDDITRFEYVKRTNRELGPALVGIEIPRSADLPGLLARMDASPLQVERIEPGSPLFHFLL